MSPSDWTDEALLDAMLDRQPEAWREFHRRFDRLIYRCIHKVTSRFPGSVAGEDVREIYALFLLGLNKRDMHKIRSFEPSRGNKLSSWIGLLATNSAWDYLRRVARQPMVTSLADAENLGSSAGSPYDHVLEKERWCVVADLLADFSEKDRTFVHLYYIDGLSPEQIADEMAISVKTVYSKKHKIRCRLTRALAPVVEQAA
ncbi:MAG: RNA polymerase sigma factor [Sandaracinaceae bacterium]